MGEGDGSPQVGSALAKRDSLPARRGDRAQAVATRRERGEERRGGENVRSPSGSYQAAERDSLHVIETKLCNFGMSHVVNYD